MNQAGPLEATQSSRRFVPRDAERSRQLRASDTAGSRDCFDNLGIDSLWI